MTLPYLLPPFTLWRHYIPPNQGKAFKQLNQTLQRTTKEKPQLIFRTKVTRFVFNFSDQVSGLSKWVGSQLANLDAIPSYAIVMSVCILITAFTEFTSNVATATIFLPILASLVRMVTTTNLILFLFSRTSLRNCICFHRPKKFKFIRGI